MLDARLVAEASAHVDWLAKRNPVLRPENLGHQLVAEDPFWVRLISDERLLDIAEHYLGPNIAPYFEAPGRRANGALASVRIVLAAGADGGCDALVGGG